MARGQQHAAGGGFSALSAALILLTTAAACASVVAVKVGNAPALPWTQLLPVGVYAVSVPFAWLWLRLSGYRGDGVIPAAALLLAGLGVVMQFRLGAYAGARPWSVSRLAYPLGCCGLLLTISFFGRQRFAALAGGGWLCYLLALGVLGAMAVLGRRYRGGVFLPGNLNPSEAVKPLLVIFLAAFLARRKKAFAETRVGLPLPPPGDLLLLGAAWALPMAAILYLKDLGLLILLNAVLVLMLFTASRRLGYLVLGAAGVAVLAAAAMTLSAHARVRFEIWSDPFADPTGKGWQVLQGLSAMYSGGMWGAGIGAGIPQAVPIAASDFVYAAWAEELGLAGCILLLVLYAALFARGWRAGTAAPTPFAALLGTGLTGTLAFQTILNVAGVTKALPLTGIPLPFISHGGSSLATTLVMAGLLAAVSDR